METYINKIIECDAIEFISKINIRPKLILTDPPYGINYKTNIPGDKRWNKTGNTNNKFDILTNDQNLQCIDFMSFFVKCYDVMDDGFLFVFCNDKALCHWSKQAEDAGFIWKDTLFWNKRCANGGDLNWPFIQIVEMILCFVKGKPSVYPMFNKDGELKKRIISLFDVGRVSKKEHCGHPTQKPLFICEQIIMGTTKTGDLVVDPFCGSGTSLFAAKKQGRLFSGCDIDKKFVEISNKRINSFS